MFDRVNVSIYVTLLGYVAIFIMLPIKLKHIWFLLTGFVVGAVVDFFMGTPGLNTIASTATAFLRPATTSLALGKDALREGDFPSPKLQGMGKWLRYAALLTGIHCLIFFLLEAFSLRNIEFTMLRMVGSWATTMILILFTGLIFPVKRQ